MDPEKKPAPQSQTDRTKNKYINHQPHIFNKHNQVTIMKKDEKIIFETLNEILTQTTRMDKALDRLERKIDKLPKTEKTKK